MRFHGKNDTFWKLYNKEMSGIPLKDAIIKSMSDEKNLLGEGMSKKGYNFVGMKDYVIRIYKKCFRKEDLDETFINPQDNYLNTLEGVVLCIPEKIDIVKKKTGQYLGVEKYAERLQINDFPLREIKIAREETLGALDLYEKLKKFPAKSYERAYLQMKNFVKNRVFNLILSVRITF